MESTQIATLFLDNDMGVRNFTPVATEIYHLLETDSIPAADVLQERKVPILFTTGYDDYVIPQRYASIQRCEKPITPGRFKKALAAALSL